MDAPSSRHTHVVPTHLRHPQTLLIIGGVSITVRQFLLLLLGVAFSYQVWNALGWLAAWFGGSVVRALFTIFAGCLALALAFVQVAARPLEVWVVVVIRYALHPKRFVWRSVRWTDPGWAAQEEKNGGKAND